MIMHSCLRCSLLTAPVVVTRNKAKLKANIVAGVLIGAVSLYAPMLNAAPIYKVVDNKTGQVTFTDRPQSYEAQSDKQVSQTNMTTGNSNNSNSSNSSGANNVNLNNDAINNNQTIETPVATVQALPINYQFAMTEPSEARAYRRPAQSIVVTIQVKPALQAGDSVSIYLDGKVVGQGLSFSMATVDMLPGQHSLQAVLKSSTGQVLQQISRTVYVIQNTATLQNNKKIAQQLLAYQQLSWQQKILLKLRQDSVDKQQQ
jgi:hypothetical protein